LGGAIIGEMEAVMDSFSDVGLGEGHGISPVFSEEISFKSLFCQCKSQQIQENEREVGLWNDLPWFCNVFQAEKV